MHWLRAQTRHVALKGGREDVVRPEDSAHAWTIVKESAWRNGTEGDPASDCGKLGGQVPKGCVSPSRRRRFSTDRWSSGVWRASATSGRWRRTRDMLCSCRARFVSCPEDADYSVWNAEDRLHELREGYMRHALCVAKQKEDL